MMDKMKTINPPILYYGTPVILLTTLNEDHSTNVSPLSSSWALGHYMVLGLGLGSKALENLRHYPECVVNVADPSLWEKVEKLAPLTGKNPVPAYKRHSFRYEKDKFAAAHLTKGRSENVKPLRVLECQLQIESQLRNIRIPEYQPEFAIVEVEAVRIHAHRCILTGNDHIDSGKWSPLIYNFRHYFGLGAELGKTFRA